MPPSAASSISLALMPVRSRAGRASTASPKSNLELIIPEVRLRPARASDGASWERLRCLLWPDGSQDHGPEISAFFAGTAKEPLAVLMAETASDEIVGFVELSIRTDLAGHSRERVGQVEALYVLPEFRGHGLARKLLRASREWAREQGSAVFASDRAERLIVDRSFSYRLFEEKSKG